MSPCDALFLSPHLDDVVLSCPARVEGSRAARVATLFSAGDTGYAERRAEDARALARLGADGVHLGLLDAPFRRGARICFSTLLLERREAPAILAAVREAIAGLLKGLSPDFVYAPLGVGGHVDHRLVHEAARCEVPPRKLRFYEDRPYALVPGATAWRLRELGAAAEVDRRALARELLQAPYVKCFLRGGDLVPLAHHLRSLGAAPEARWCSDVEVHGADAGLRAVKLAQLYGSQWAAFHGTEEVHQRLLHDAAAALGAPGRYAERFWSLEG